MMDDPRFPHLKGLDRPKVHYTTVALPPPGDVLYRECVALRREMPRLLAEGLEGKTALVKGDEIIGIFDDDREAYRVGCEMYLMQPFLVQPILEWETVLYMFGHVKACPSSPSL
jgi:hypothetical protein